MTDKLPYGITMQGYCGGTVAASHAVTATVAKCDLCDRLGDAGGFLSIWTAIDKQGNSLILCTVCANRLRFSSTWKVDEDKLEIKET